MTLTVALAGDTMLGRGVGDRLAHVPASALFSGDLVDAAHEADLFVLNLECCISSRGEPWPDPGKPFFFRAPPEAVEALTLLGVDCVTLANNHALDYGEEALLDTIEHLRGAGIAVAGAGATPAEAHEPALLRSGGATLGVVGVTDHPVDYAVGEGRPGVAYADLGPSLPEWLARSIDRAGAEADVVLVSPHWGPNMTAAPVPRVRAAGAALAAAGATLVAGHSAHVFHGVEGRILYDLGDFLDDYRTDPLLRNDLGLLFLVTLDELGPTRIEAVPLALGFCRTSLAHGEAAAWIAQRFRSACRAFGTEVDRRDDRLTATPSRRGASGSRRAAR